jgi:UDP-glucose 4-epimerase
MTRYMVTGGCGFIGRTLIKNLGKEAGAKVLVLDSLVAGSGDSFQNERVELVVADIRDREAVECAAEGVDCIIHLAAFSGVRPSLVDPHGTIEVNVTGSVNVLEAARRHQVRSVVLASTAGAIMGDRPPPLREDMVPTPTSPYGASKLAMEAYASSYAAAYSLPVTCLRFANVYGPYSEHKAGIVTAALKAALKGQTLTVYGDGKQERDFIFVADVCDAILAACARPAPGEEIQIASGEGTSVLNLMSVIEEITGCSIQVTHSPPNAGEVREVWCEVTKAELLLDWHPRTALPQGLKTTADWYVERARTTHTYTLS